MAVNWNKVKFPALFTMLGVLLLLSVKNCSDNKKSREGDEKVAANIDTILQERRNDADTIKAYAEAIYDNTEEINRKVDKVQETGDSILARVRHIDDSCCGCNDKPVVKPKQKPAKRPADTTVSRHRVTDTLYIPVVVVPVETPVTSVPEEKPIEATVRCRWVQEKTR
jgi:hypothetical protein